MTPCRILDDRQREHERDRAAYAAWRRVRDLLIAAGRGDEAEP